MSPLIQPKPLREKILLIAAAKAGKTTSWMSICYWAWKSGNTQKFYVIDTEDAVMAVLNEEKYEGMLAEDGGNLHLYVVTDWEDYLLAKDDVLKRAKAEDWVVIDMVTHAWTTVQAAYLRMVKGKTRGEALLDAAKGGASGWDLFKVDYNWPVINAMYDDFLKELLMKTRAHIFMVAEMEEIQDRGKMTEDAKEHLAQFGKWKAVGQKKLPYQCRSYIRLQRLARGRVLFTQGDRAREELKGDDMSPDFFMRYLRDVGGWSVDFPEEEKAE